MSWSTICANASISVTPGSETLWSVHSGQRCWTSRLASSTRSWKCRSSRSGAGSISSRSQCWCDGRGLDRLGLVGDHVEREDQVAGVAVTDDLVAHVHVERADVDRIEGDLHVEDVDPR